MHFGKRLEQDLVERWRPHYLQYKPLKKQIKEMEKQLRDGSAEAPSNDDAANGLLANQQISYHEFSFPGPKAHRFSLVSSFKSLLDKEVEKINLFTTARVGEVRNRILQILRNSSPWKAFSTAPLSAAEQAAADTFLEQQTNEANTIAQELVDLDKFIRQNCIAVQKIIKKFDKRLKFDVAPWLNAQLMENEPFLKVNLDALLIAVSDVFERIGYFKAELKSMCAPVAGESSSTADPVAKKGISAQSFERKTTKYWVRSEHLMAIKVAIIKNLPVYLFDRKHNDEGTKGKNFLRDFGELYGDMSDSSPITSIYLDDNDMGVYHSRITREESSQLFRLRWYGDAKSLPEKDHVFLERKTHHESWVLAKSVKERFPIKTKNVQAFLEGKFSPSESMKKWMKPDSKGSKLIKNDAELEKAIQLANESFETIQKRKLRPMVRTLYRRAAFQARDHNQVRISIDTQLMMVNEDVMAPPGSDFPWCRDMVKTHIPPSDILQFPYCILEVKLNCDAPPVWIKDLLQDQNTVIECHKFSKFLTGIAYHQYKKVRELPHWFKDQVALDPRNRFLSNEEKEKLIYRDTAIKFSDKNDKESDSDADAPDKEPYHAIDMPVDEKTPLLQYEKKSTPAIMSNGSSSMTFRHGTSTRQNSGMFSTLKNRFGWNKSDDHMVGRDAKQPLKPTRTQNRIKIEPKTSFANERTLIQWVSAASLMITLATLIMTSGSEMGFKAGFVFFPLAFVIMVYAIVRYQYRAWSFRNRRNAYHDDLYGPVFLVIAIASAMGVIMYLMFYYSGDLPFATPISSVAGGCSQLSGLPSPYFPVSDVAVDGESVWISGPFQVSRLQNGQSDWETFHFPGQSISAVAPGPADGFFVSMEKPQLAITHVDASGQASEDFDVSSLRSFNISPKALTFIDDSNFLVADYTGSIYQVQIVDAIDVRSNRKLQLVSTIPSQRTTTGFLNDDFYKQISGMYFDRETSRLFVLFANYRTLRVFDFKTATLLNDWYLPGTSFQWTGVALHASSIYLSQAVPSAVWKFQIQGNVTHGPIFPACANVYDGDLIEIMHQSSQGDRFRRNRPSYVTDY